MGAQHRPNPPALPVQRLFESAVTLLILPPVETKEAILSFEAALTNLETIVEAMESGDVPLAELLAKFEEGTKLLKICEARLKEAELKIEVLKQQKDGVSFEKFATERES